MAEESPESTVEGFAEQLTVGGSNAFTTYAALQSAFSSGFVAFGYMTFQGVGAGSEAVVSIIPVSDVPVTVPPSTDHV